VKSSDVDGLFFAGDQYGRRLWGGGIDGAALSAVLCVDAITGEPLENEIFPWFHRGLPD
jgi:flavin-dependent dehydrogenase